MEEKVRRVLMSCAHVQVNLTLDRRTFVCVHIGCNEQSPMGVREQEATSPPVLLCICFLPHPSLLLVYSYNRVSLFAKLQKRPLFSCACGWKKGQFNISVQHLKCSDIVLITFTHTRTCTHTNHGGDFPLASIVFTLS